MSSKIGVPPLSLSEFSSLLPLRSSFTPPGNRKEVFFHPLSNRRHASPRFSFKLQRSPFCPSPTSVESFFPPSPPFLHFPRSVEVSLAFRRKGTSGTNPSFPVLQWGPCPFFLLSRCLSSPPLSPHLGENRLGTLLHVRKGLARLFLSFLSGNRLVYPHFQLFLFASFRRVIFLSPKSLFRS